MKTLALLIAAALTAGLLALAIGAATVGKPVHAGSRGRARRRRNYPLDRIDADGTLHAGCHTIPYSEIAMMARTLKLEV